VKLLESSSILRKYLKWCVQLQYYILTNYSNPSQMFVFGEVQDPNMDTVNLVEDIVRSQLIELVNIYTHLLRVHIVLSNP
jgi:hypothetical protein